MCIIAISPKNTPIPSYNKRSTMFSRNPDGAGFMFPKGGKVHIEKGFMTFDAMEQRLSEVGKMVDLTKTPIVFHYRIGTHGGNIPQNTHPFPVSSQRHNLKALNIDTWMGCVHNGIIRSIKPKKGYSDTQEYIVKKLSKYGHGFTHSRRILSLIEVETGSKLAFLDPTGEITIVGRFINDEDGCMYSNYTYEAFDYESYYGRGYGSWAWTWKPGIGLVSVQTTQPTTAKTSKDDATLKSVVDAIHKDVEDNWFDPDMYDEDELDVASLVSGCGSVIDECAFVKPLDGEIVIDGDGNLCDGAEFCMDGYKRIYRYDVGETAILDSRARIWDGAGNGASAVNMRDPAWDYDDYDRDDWEDLTYLPAKQGSGLPF